MKPRIEFNYSPKGYGTITIHTSSSSPVTFPARTGANHFRNGELTLVNAIPPGEWFIIEPPAKTTEKGMFIPQVRGFGWKIRLYRKELDEFSKPKYKPTSYLIHPDGNEPGTLGCLGIQKTNAPELFQFFLSVFSLDNSLKIPVTISESVPELTTHEPKEEPKPEQPKQSQKNEPAPTKAPTLPASKTEAAGIAAIIIIALKIIGVDIPDTSISTITAMVGAAIGIGHRLFKIIKGGISK
jgi:hypothetical protein